MRFRNEPPTSRSSGGSSPVRSYSSIARRKMSSWIARRSSTSAGAVPRARTSARCTPSRARSTSPSVGGIGLAWSERKSRMAEPRRRVSSERPFFARATSSAAWRSTSASERASTRGSGTSLGGTARGNTSAATITVTPTGTRASARLPHVEARFASGPRAPASERRRATSAGSGARSRAGVPLVFDTLRALWELGRLRRFAPWYHHGYRGRTTPT